MKDQFYFRFHVVVGLAVLGLIIIQLIMGIISGIILNSRKNRFKFKIILTFHKVKKNYLFFIIFLSI